MLVVAARFSLKIDVNHFSVCTRAYRSIRILRDAYRWIHFRNKIQRGRRGGTCPTASRIKRGRVRQENERPAGGVELRLSP